MRHSLTDLLMCPYCGGSYDLVVVDGGTDEVERGDLRCRGCGRSVPIRDGIPRFVGSEDYASAFGFEWTRCARVQLDSATGTGESRRRLQDAFTFPLADLSGKLVLDAGCGMGRFSEVALEEGAEVVCVDLTRAIDAARANLGRFPRAHFIQADLFALPLRPRFDVVFSLGVLHHTPDPPRAFRAVAGLLAPGGVISIRVYAAYNKAYIAVTEFYRRLTKRLPPSVLFRLCYLAVPLYYVNKVPVVGPFVTRLLLPVSVTPPTHMWRVCNTFDLYSPRYQFFHTHAEVNDWLLEAGLEGIRVVDPEGGVCFEGWRPPRRRVAPEPQGERAGGVRTGDGDLPISLRPPSP